jgi:hypothetical protein
MDVEEFLTDMSEVQTINGVAEFEDSLDPIARKILKNYIQLRNCAMIMGRV